MDRRPLRRRACAATRDDLALLDRRGAALVGRRARRARARRGRGDATRLARLSADPWRVYFALWAVTPMLFFTPARNILITYVLPGLPAFALLLGEAWRPAGGERGESPDATRLRPAVVRRSPRARWFRWSSLAGLVLMHGTLDAERSQKALARAYSMQRPGPEVTARLLSRSAGFGRVLRAGSSEKGAGRRVVARTAGNAGRRLFRDSRSRPCIAAARRPGAAEAIGSYGDFRLLRKAPR